MRIETEIKKTDLFSENEMCAFNNVYLHTTKEFAEAVASKRYAFYKEENYDVRTKCIIFEYETSEGFLFIKRFFYPKERNIYNGKTRQSIEK